MKKEFRIITLALLLYMPSGAQTFDWWKNLVNWDGSTYWLTYMTTSPKFYGPNALSIPFINNGIIDTANYLSATASFHFSKGDKTQNMTLYGNYSPKNSRISIDAQWVAHEWFQVTHATKEERKVYYQGYYTKSTVGDVIANTTIRLFDKWRKHIQLAFRLGIRMPSGGGQSAARYADVTAYWLDFGGAILFRNPEWKWINMFGYYIWQVNAESYGQDDAMMYATGLQWDHKGMRIQGYLSGYDGYKENGDAPLVVRLNLEKKKKNCVYLFRLQKGLHDYKYFTIETGAKFILGK
ncbi:MAG TPA: hypothetical protein VLJ68_14110 [Chitinophagaceae bacterium]|nr:hypothetical protein [Chitinophagaceae bacterium]